MINARQGPEALDLNRLVLAVAEDRDREAFKQLFEHFAPRLKSFLLRNGGAALTAEEIVQETMVKVWRKAGQFDPAKASAATWIFTIARNQRIDMIRKTQRPEPDADDPAYAPDPAPQAFDDVARRQQAERLRDVLENLPKDQHEVLHLAFFEEKTHVEIAAQLDLPLGTVKSRIRLAMNRMRAELGDEP